MLSRLRRALVGLTVIAASTVAIPVVSSTATALAPTSVRPQTQVTPMTLPAWSNTNIVAVSTGFNGTCAIQGASAAATSGTLFCWGKGPILGAASFTSSNVAVAVPAAGSFTNTAVTAVAVGDEHACAIEGGQLWCWGGGSPGSFGVLGNGTSGFSLYGPTLVSANDGFDNDGAAGDAVTAISTSYAQACAIEGGQVFCWGNNNGNQLGLGPTPPYPTNVPYRVVDTATPEFHAATATEVSVGFSYGCATASTSVYCWGIDSYGNLGNSPTSAGVPVKVAQGSFTTGNTNVSGLDSGWDHSCARQSDTLRCWGRGTHYQLGTGSTNNASTPTNVGTGVDFVNSGFVTAVSAGERHTCAIEAGRLFCWGDNGSGRLGNGSTTAATAPVLVSPSDVVGFMNTSQVTAVSAGQEHTCAIENKVVYCWGGNMDGQLGLGQLFGPPPTKPTKVFVVSAPDAPSISVMSQNAALSVTVTKPSDGGSTITSYEYQVDSGAIVSEPFSGFNSQTITISGLTNGTSYNVRVRAVNAIGAGAWSVTSGGMPSAGVNPNPNPNPNNPQPQQCTTGAYTFTGSSPVLDTSWGTSGWTSLAPGGGFFASRAILATPDSNDNNYLLLSNTMGQNFDALAIHKFDATGTLVSGFGTGGMLTIESQSADLGFRGYAVDAAGSILVITQDYSQPQPTFNVVGLTSTGLLDTSFANSGFLSVTLPPSSSLAGWNSIYGGSAGEFFIVSGVFGQASTYSIQKFNSSGLVNGFGTAGVLDVTSVGGRSMAVLQDGSLLVGGAVQGQLNLSKYSSAGVLDTAWATNGVSTFGNPNSIESISDLDVSGQSVIVTYRSNVFVQNGPPQSKNGVAKVGLDGVVDTTFGDAGGVLAPQRAGATFAPEGHVLSDGSIVVGLFSDTGFMAQTYGLIRFSATGDLDTAFASNDARITHGTCGVEYAGLADLGSGAVLVAGSKSPGGNMAPTESVLAKLTFSTVVPGINGGGFTGSGSNPNPNPNPNPGPNNNVFVPVTPPTTPPTDDEDDEPRVPGRPNLVNDDNRPGLVRPPGQSGLVVDGETQEVVTTRIETPGSNVQPNRRTPAQIQQIREAANNLVQNFQQQLPQGTNVPFEVVNTPTGAVIRNLVFDASGNPVDVPAEDIVLMEAEEMVLMVGANQANVTPDGRFQVPVGSSFGLAGSGFGDEEDGEFVVMSTPTLIAEFATAEDGTFEKSGTLPASIAVGDHTLVVATGSTYAVLGIQVVPTTLPVTGGDSNQVVVFALFTLVFGALLVRSRRTLLV